MAWPASTYGKKPHCGNLQSRRRARRPATAAQAKPLPREINELHQLTIPATAKKTSHFVGFHNLPKSSFIRHRAINCVAIVRQYREPITLLLGAIARRVHAGTLPLSEDNQTTEGEIMLDALIELVQAEESQMGVGSPVVVAGGRRGVIVAPEPTGGSFGLLWLVKLPRGRFVVVSRSQLALS